MLGSQRCKVHQIALHTHLYSFLSSDFRDSTFQFDQCSLSKSAPNRVSHLTMIRRIPVDIHIRLIYDRPPDRRGRNTEALQEPCDQLTVRYGEDPPMSPSLTDSTCAPTTQNTPNASNASLPKTKARAPRTSVKKGRDNATRPWPNNGVHSITLRTL